MSTNNSLFLQALQGKNTAQIPFWFMRQAGRYLPEYRALRAQKGGFLAMAMDPQSACEITLQPLRRFGMDAAIIFSDILVVPMALGQKLEFLQGEGPHLDAIGDHDGLKKLGFRNFDTTLQPVYEALSLTRQAMDREGYDAAALIGFAGAPWTVATYMIEGGSSRDFFKTRQMAYRQPEFFSSLIDLLTEATSKYLAAQIKAGAQALQIFDSWAGALSPLEFERWVIEPTQKILSHIRQESPGTPVICFPKGAGSMMGPFTQALSPQGLSLDAHTDPAWAVSFIKPGITLQGNLDPMALLAGGAALEREARRVLEKLSVRPMIFNLGHGIHKDTPPEHVYELVRLIREFRRAS